MGGGNDFRSGIGVLAFGPNATQYAPCRYFRNRKVGVSWVLTGRLLRAYSEE
jgi:hypothetical protein